MANPSPVRLALGDHVYDHFAQRLGQVYALDDDGTPHLAAGKLGPQWSCPDLWRLGLERLEPPSLLVLVRELDGDAAAVRARLRALDPVELVITLGRGLRSGPARRPADPPVLQAALEREAAAQGGPSEMERIREGVEALRGRDDPRARRVESRESGVGVALALPEVSDVVRRLIVPTRSLDTSAPIPGRARSVLIHAQPLFEGATPLPHASEALLASGLRELVRITALRGGASPIDQRRRDRLEPALRSVFTCWSESRARLTETRQGRNFEPEAFIADEAFELLICLLVTGGDVPIAVAALRRRLEAWPASDGASDQSLWQLVHCALGAAFDELHPERRVSEISRRTRHSLDRLGTGPDDEGSAIELEDRGYVGDDPAVRDLGAREFNAQSVVLAGEGSTPQQVRAVARALIHTIRASFAASVARLCPDGDRSGLTQARYQTHLLDFLSHLGVPEISRFSGENTDTVRARYPRSGDRTTAKIPAFVKGLVPEDLREFVVCFGRLFLLLRFALVPDREELVQVTASDAEHDALTQLFFQVELSGTNEGWLERDLEAAARRTGRADVAAFVAEVLFPTLERVVDLRRRRSLERGEAEVVIDDTEALRIGLEVLLVGVPDGQALELHLARRFGPDMAARRAFAVAAGLQPPALADLVLGRRWVLDHELAGLSSALGADAGTTLLGIRPRVLVPLGEGPQDSTGRAS